MRYSSALGLKEYVGMVLMGAAALGGCGDKTQVQTGRAVSGLENTVLAETRNAGSNGSVSQKEELDLSTPEKAVTNFLEAIRLRNKNSYLSTLQEPDLGPFDEMTTLQSYKIDDVKGDHVLITCKLDATQIKRGYVKVIKDGNKYLVDEMGPR